MKRLFRWRRPLGLAIGAAARFVLRRTTARSVDRATADIEARLPGPVRKALEIVPADAVRAGGSAVVAGRTARRVATGAHRASLVTTEQGRRLSSGVARIRSIGGEIAGEAEVRRRELKADYLRVTEGNTAADDALLDVRDRRSSGGNGANAPAGDAEGPEVEDLPELDPPIRPGRWRAERRLGAGAVARVQRSYQPRKRPWDR